MQSQYTDVFLGTGDVIFIPPYWWYAIRFSGPCVIGVYRYGTIMSNASIIPHWIRYMFQRHNIIFKPNHIVPTASKIENDKPLVQNDNECLT